MKTDNKSWKGEKWLNIWTLLVTALFFRLFLLRFQYAISFDEAHYLRMAAGFSQIQWKEIYHIFWSPGYPLFAGILMKIISNFELAGRLTNILFGTLTVIPVYYFTRRLLNKKIAVLSALFFALYPPVAGGHTSALAEPTFVFFGFLGFWLGWLLIEKGFKWLALLAGICFGFAYLGKPEGFFFILFYGIVFSGLCIAGWLKKGRKYSFLILIFLMIGFMLPSINYLSYLKNKAGYWTLSAKSAAFQQWHSTFFTPEDDDIFHDLNEENTIFLNDAILHEGSFFTMNKEPGSEIKVTLPVMVKKYITYFFRTLKYEVPSLLTFYIFILFTLGLFGWKWEKSQIPLLIYLASFLFIYWFILIPNFVLTERYLKSMFPLVSIWTGLGIMVFYNWFKSLIEPYLSNHVKMLSLVFTILLILGLAVIPYMGKVAMHGPESGAEYDDPVELKLAGQWLQENTCQHPPILISRSKTVNFYAGNYNIREGISFPRENSERILDYARNKNVHYFVLAERYQLAYPSSIQGWLKGDVPNELELIYENAGPSRQKVWIYTWKDENQSLNQSKNE